MRRALVAVAVLVALSPLGAEAARRAVLLPVAAAGRDAAEGKLAATIEPALVEAVRKAGVEIANLDGNKLRGPSRADAKADPRPQARAQALAKEHGVELGLSAEPQPLGDGAVVYVQVVEAGGKVLGSTTVALDAELLHKGGPDLERALRGGVLQILDPKHFVGRLELRVDVKDAEAQLDGRAVPIPPPGQSIALSVGPHAVRVTHPAYRDFLRFVEIGFDRTTTEQIALAAFPLTEGEMAEKRRRGAAPAAVKPPWYRSWWALTITGAVLVGVTTGIVFGVRAGVEADHEARYRVVPSP